MYDNRYTSFPKSNQKTNSISKLPYNFLTVFKHFITFIRFKIKVSHHLGCVAEKKVDGIHPVENGADGKVDVADEKVDGIHPVGNGADEKVDGIHLVGNGADQVGDFI